MTTMQKWRQRAIDAMARAAHWGDRKVPRGLRAVLGVLAVCGGFLGFLPILGFWMIPVGATLIALDVPPWRRRLMAWLDRHAETERQRTQA